MIEKRKRAAPKNVDWLATEQWVRNPTDELAIENGCWFDAERAAWAAFWIEKHCRLYIGEWAGKQIRLQSTAEYPERGWEVPDRFEDALPLYLERMREHNRLWHNGEFMHWHAEFVFQVYGWVRTSHRYKNDDGEWRAVRRFREAMAWIAKKNGKSPFMAANGLYLTAGDGEPGAQVAFCAKDGAQAKKTVGSHAFKMVEKSPELNSECDTHKNDCVISHRETDSEMFALNSGNVRSADAKHGLDCNGILIDECHVVNRTTAARVGRATRARSEPLTIKVSTAGDNPDSWGKEQFDRAQKIVDGEIKTDTVYVAMHAAPQNATDDDIRENLEEYVRMANPAMGHIVDLQETIDDYESVKDSAYDFAIFKYEILNIWQHAAVTWIKRAVWIACGGWRYDESIQGELPCVLGYDHAKSKDLSSAVLSWPNENESVDLKAFFWCNERRIRQLSQFKPEILEWVEGGFIKVTGGDTHDTGLIKRDLRDIILKYGVIGMVHDPYYCEEIIGFLRDGESDKEGNVIWEPVLTHEDIVKMNQQKATQTGPTTFFEEDVINGKLRHEDNPVLDWQFSHATIGQDQRGNIVIQKENRASFRTVDGCQASVMARWGVLDYPDFQTQVLSFYDDGEDVFF